MDIRVGSEAVQGALVAEMIYITGDRPATHVLASGTRSAVSLRRYTASLPPTRCAAHREPFSYVEVDVRGGVVCGVLGINPLKKGTVPFS